MNEKQLTVLQPQFAHPAERALADLFDRHGIRWIYEPHLFEIDVDGDGRTRRGFRPDFFLPDLDIYVECTMMKQSLTTRKNRKARAAAEKHGIVVVVFYRRDFERLRAQHGLRLDEAA
jgi:hypoxanthine phosphoribosyltransferase